MYTLHFDCPHCGKSIATVAIVSVGGPRPCPFCNKDFTPDMDKAKQDEVELPDLF